MRTHSREKQSQRKDEKSWRVAEEIKRQILFSANLCAFLCAPLRLFFSLVEPT
jgi:hypothetical protein